MPYAKILCPVDFSVASHEAMVAERVVRHAPCPVLVIRPLAAVAST